MTDRPFTDAERKELEQIQKLLDKAAGSTHPAEAEAFMAKAQEKMTRLSVDTATVERQSGKQQGKREDQKVDGGFYLFQRDLWRSVAELNFCMYWTQEYVVKLDKPLKRYHWYNKDKVFWHITKKRHRLVGRQVNVAMAIGMANYLQGAIERELKRVCTDEQGADRAWGNSFREGCTSVLLEKLAAQFRRKLAEESKRQAGPRPTSGFGRELALADVKKVEEQGNYDFLHGEGAWARREERRAQIAKEEAEAEAAYTAWAKANPEEAARKEKEEQERARKYWSRYRGGSRSYAERKEDNRDHVAFHLGRDAAANISLHQQAENRKPSGLLK